MVIGVICLSIFSIYRQTEYARNGLISQYRDVANILATEVEVGYYESKWPFESLKKLTQKNDFLFWWLIDERGRIYLSDNSTFMGTDARSYYPNINRQPNLEGFTNTTDGGGGIYYKNFEAGKKQWSFWIGFSLASLNSMVQRIILINILVALAGWLVASAALYFIVRQAMRPLDGLVQDTRIIAAGKLDHRIKAKGGEFGYLATAFNNMAGELQGQYRELEEKVQERTAELEKASTQLAIEKKNALDKAEELERMNAVMIGRELKMVGLKEENLSLKKKIGLE